MLEEIGFKRDFLCWRGREFDEHYECRVAGTGAGGANIEFGLDGIDVGAEVAADLAFCLSEALAIAKQADVNSTTAAVREEGSLSRKYRLWCGAWQFSADGVVPVESASVGNFDGTQSTGIFVAVRTIEAGGFELEFGEMGYSFSAQDASWLQEKLLEVSQQLPVLYTRVGLLEAVNSAWQP